MVLLLAFATVQAWIPVAQAQEFAWIRQFGTSLDDVVWDLAGVASDLYVGGRVDGALPGQISSGGMDVFVRKYDAAGSELWTRQFGTSYNEEGSRIAADVSGVYVIGSTEGTLPGQTSSGLYDAFIRKYDPSGTELWTLQFGTTFDDTAEGIAVDLSNIYVAGGTSGTLGENSSGGYDGFVRKYDASRTEVWTRQFGSGVSIWLRDVSVDASGVYIAGKVSGVLPGQTSSGGDDAFVRKYDLVGTELWTRQFGSGFWDKAEGIAVEGSGVYVAGEVEGGALPGQTWLGGDDAFVRKYSASGTEVWTRQFGTADHDEAWGIAVDASGVYVAGGTSGTLPQQVSAGAYDTFARKYDASGTELWTHQFGSPGFDLSLGVSVDASHVYVAGHTRGALPGQTALGMTDAFAAKFTPQTAAGPLVIDLTGEFDYLERETVPISVAALIRDAATLAPASDADARIRIYDQRGRIRVSAPMVEAVPGTGVFRWTSSGTISQLWWLFPKGIYLAVVEASLDGGPVARAILEFHIDPPGEASAAATMGPYSLVDVVTAVCATAAVMGLLFHRRQVLRVLRQRRSRP